MDLLTGIVIILTCGILAQWVAWRLRLPSILFLLMLGFLMGPVTGFLDVNALFGDGLLSVISLAVAVILFEGGLNLRIKDMAGTGAIIVRLLTIGAFLTWIMTAVAALLFLRVDVRFALLIGAILVVTGPTVVIPIINQVRPSARVGAILRWEGIVIDPVGAVLTVLVFEAISITDTSAGAPIIIIGFIKTILIGCILGYIVARLLILLSARDALPHYLESPITLILVLVSFVISNLMQHESGLLTVTVAGIVLANQDLKLFGRWPLVPGHHAELLRIIEFKENLQVLLVSTLFIVLAGRLQIESLMQLDWGAVLFIVALIFVIRPLAVWVCTLGSPLPWQEKLFLGWMAPRGIVAAAVASVFALELIAHDVEHARLLVPIVFAVIIVTVIVYGFTSRPLANRLGLVQKQAMGLLIVGAHQWARQIALTVQQLGYRVLLVDTNYNNIQAARLQGLNVFYGSVMADSFTDEIDLSGIGRLLALTSNDEVNALACVKYSRIFGADNVYQLVPLLGIENRNQRVNDALSGHFLFDNTYTYDVLQQLFASGSAIKATPLTAEFGPEKYQQQYEGFWSPLFQIDQSKSLVIIPAGTEVKLKPSTTIISLIEPEKVDASVA
ncbi:MAG: hypothetical protein GC179_01220 [Anaerolineaceae bacterium]|nr:hypothetical protein [Anaerolineaceae bacterium]